MDEFPLKPTDETITCLYCGNEAYRGLKQTPLGPVVALHGLQGLVTAEGGGVAPAPIVTPVELFVCLHCGYVHTFAFGFRPDHAESQP